MKSAAWLSSAAPMIGAQTWRERMLPEWKSYEVEIGVDLMRAAMTVNRRR